METTGKKFWMTWRTSLSKTLGIALLALLACACSNSDDDSNGSSLLPSTDNNEGSTTPADTIKEEPIAVLDSVEFRCKRGDLEIYGLMYSKVVPGKKVPAVILSHSSSLTHAAMKDYARAIADKGMVAYCFDFCGGSTESKSDGSTDDMTVFTEVDDLKAVIDAVSRLETVDADSIYLLGSSQGGLVSALVAEECAQSVRGMILFYPAFNIPEMVSKYGDIMNQWGNMGNWGDLGNWGDWSDLMNQWGDLSSLMGSMSMSETFINAIKGYDVWSHIGTFPRHVTIIHGSADIIVPVENSEKAVKLYPDAELHLIEGANHGFNAANLGSMGSMMGASADYDAQVLPLVFEALNR